MRGQYAMVCAAVASALVLVAGRAQAGSGQTTNNDQTVKLVYFNARGGAHRRRQFIAGISAGAVEE
jgi:hypothetical protein